MKKQHLEYAIFAAYILMAVGTYGHALNNCDKDSLLGNHIDCPALAIIPAVAWPLYVSHQIWKEGK